MHIYLSCLSYNILPKLFLENLSYHQLYDKNVEIIDMDNYILILSIDSDCELLFFELNSTKTIDYYQGFSLAYQIFAIDFIIIAFD